MRFLDKDVQFNFYNSSKGQRHLYLCAKDTANISKLHK